MKEKCKGVKKNANVECRNRCLQLNELARFPENDVARLNQKLTEMNQCYELQESQAFTHFKHTQRYELIWEKFSNIPVQGYNEEKF